MTVDVTTLPNGLRVASRCLPGVETAAVGLYVATGSRFETESGNGTAHMLEHMVFKGTERRTARKIAEEIEAAGGSLNAYTARDVTAFHSRLLADDLELGIDIISDLVMRPLFDEEDLHRERDVILQELFQARETPDDIIFDHLHEAAFPDQPIGRSILGSEETIASLGTRDMRDWLDCHFRAGSMVLSAAGKVDHQQLVDLAGRYFDQIGSGAAPGAEQASYAASDRRDARKLDQSHIMLGLEGPSHLQNGYEAAMLFATALGGGMSSRLFQELREERGLAYSIHSSLSPFADTGLFSVYLATSPGDAQKSLDLVRAIIRSAADELEPHELARAKAQLKSDILMSLESCGGLSEMIARQLMIRGEILSPRQLAARIDGCTIDQVRAAGRNMMQSAEAIAAVGRNAGRLS